MFVEQQNVGIERVGRGANGFSLEGLLFCLKSSSFEELNSKFNCTDKLKIVQQTKIMLENLKYQEETKDKLSRIEID